MYDIAIIGAGVVGCSIARELAKYQLKICLLEKDEDVSTETSKANSGIVHGGYAEKHGSVKSKFCAAGNKLYRQLESELHFGFAEVGSFVIGFDAKDEAKIKSLYENGKKNGALGLEIVNGDFVRAKEPQLNKDIKIALYCSTAGVTSPYEFAIALAENAIENGVVLKLNSEVTEIKKSNDHFELNIGNREEKITAKLVINAAGLYADEIARMVGDQSFSIAPRQGQYLLFDKDQGHLINSVIFQTPTEISKGILVTKTYHGNLLIGPDAENVSSKADLDTSGKNISYIIEMARKSLPNFDLRKVITAFSGNRAAPSTDDFIIGESEIKGFINVAGIESPGLTAAPAIALHVVDLVAKTWQIAIQKKSNFNPYRKPYNFVAHMAEEELNALIKKDPAYGCIVCRCETVSEGEIRDALRRPIPINSLDAIKRRARAGMGRCQGGFCTPKIMEIIYDELNLPREKITKKGGESLMVVGRTKRALEK
jgi:glycerol-3-phosphate dehydrogenase